MWRKTKMCDKKHKCDKCRVKICETREVVNNPKFLEHDREVLKSMIDKHCEEYEEEN